jgi:hypothetical protein
MTDVTENKKRPTLKLLAITAFIGLIGLVAWLSIQLVNSAPDAFNSLASIAESVNQQTSASDSLNDEPVQIVVASNKTLINTQEAIDLSWNTTRTPGSYTFSYVCTDGVAIDIVDSTNSFQNIACGTNYNIGNTDSLSLIVESEKNRFENISYTLSFLTTSDTTPSASGTASFMVVNSEIQDEVIEEEVTEEVELVTEEETITVTTDEETNPVVVTPPTPVLEQEFTYEIPLSNPDGRVDLGTRYVGMGIIAGNSFLPQFVSRTDDGAIQFEVKNYGTKTSEDWVFSITMPNGNVYESATQEPLKPNERAVLTIGFAAADVAQHTFEARITEGSDENTINNQFVQAVTFAR